MNSNDEWHVVQKGSKKNQTNTSFHKEKVEAVWSHIFMNETELLDKFRTSPIFEKTLAQILQFLKPFLSNKSDINLTIRSIGVGPTTASLPAYLQTTFIYLIQESLKVFFSSNNIQVKKFLSIINDPVFTEKDLQYISEHGMTRVENDEELMTSKEGEISIFYMPHCEKELYVKVIKLNESNLKSCCLIGNSFKGYIRQIELVGKQKAFEGFPVLKNLVKSDGYREEMLPGFESCYEAFNNTAFMTFN